MKPNLASRRRGLAAGVCFMVLGLTAGCVFRQLKHEVARLESQCYIVGELVSAVPAGATNYAVVFQPTPTGSRLVDVAVIAAASRSVVFSLPWATNYFFGAFCDTNGNQRYEAGEPVWVHGAPSAVEFDQQRRTGRIPIRYGAALNLAPELLTGLRAARGNFRLEQLQQHGQVAFALGEVTTLADLRFSPENGSRGLWEPASSLNEQGIGIYFLERYDPKRIPVLFVHGAGGTPRDWSGFAEKFDRKNYQLWFYSYPSGLRVADCARVLEKGVEQLQRQFGFERVHVVAHSMGGLVSRLFLLNHIRQHQQPYVRRFVTLATPWRGHEAAALGVQHAPAAVPSWIDMQTDSDFTRQLFTQSLAPQVQHYLAFTYGGKESPFLPESNDGTVSVASQLKPEAQAAATKIRGFNESHDAVLHSAAALRWVEQVLAEP